MDPTGGSTPLPPSPSPLPPSPYQQTYTPESGLTFGPSAASPPPVSTPVKKGPPKAIGVVVIIVFVMVILVVSGALDGLFASTPSSTQPNVSVTSTSASHTCPTSGTPIETYRFTLVNSDTVNAAVTLGFYLNSVQVMSGTYGAPAGTSTPYVVTANLASCPPSGSTYYLSVVSIAAA